MSIEPTLQTLPTVLSHLIFSFLPPLELANLPLCHSLRHDVLLYQASSSNRLKEMAEFVVDQERDDGMAFTNS